MKYLLEKIAMTKPSKVSIGSISKGILLIKNGDNLSEDMDNIQEGSMIVVGQNILTAIKTSTITEILQKTDDTVMFKTTTSTYLLEKLND